MLLPEGTIIPLNPLITRALLEVSINLPYFVTPTTPGVTFHLLKEFCS